MTGLSYEFQTDTATIADLGITSDGGVISICPSEEIYFIHQSTSIRITIVATDPSSGESNSDASFLVTFSSY